MDKNRNKFPKILVISETFRLTTGGGITLSNLFKDYPKECLANAVFGNCTKHINSDEICDNFYSLGKKERKVLKIFSFLYPEYQSGKYNYRRSDNVPLEHLNIKGKLKEYIIRYFNLFLKLFSVHHVLTKYIVSVDFGKWVNEFQPDYIYSQLSSLEMIRFTNELVDFTGARLAIHIMDDWPNCIGNHGIVRFYWKNKIDSEFRALLEKTTIFMSISEGMSEEYKIRYNKTFIPFHNPVQIEDWLPYKKNNYDINLPLTIIYSGRIGISNSTGIIEICKIINRLNKEKKFINLEIYSSDYYSGKARSLNRYKGVHIYSSVPFSQMPELLSGADILLLPIDFTKSGIRFAKYSMPTKASEYMISGTPVLLYCSSELNLYKHAKEHDWAYIVSENNPRKIANAIQYLYENKQVRERIGTDAANFAISNYDSKIVRTCFHNLFIEDSQKII